MSEAITHAVQAERRRLLHLLHGGIVQQVTALSLAVDSALLHAVEDRDDELRAALRTARSLADTTVTECRAVLDQLVDGADA
jgi:signal transduction histidine kinase